MFISREIVNLFIKEDLFGFITNDKVKSLKLKPENIQHLFDEAVKTNQDNQIFNEKICQSMSLRFLNFLVETISFHHFSFLRQVAQIEKIEEKKKDFGIILKGGEKALIRYIKKQRKPDQQLEIERLKRILPDKDFKKIYYSPQQENHLRIMLGHALEIRKLYQDSHYTFTHSMNITWSVFICLIKMIEKIKEPQKDLSLFKHFRFSNHSQCESAVEFLQKHTDLVDCQNTDHIYRDELLSVDGYIWSQRFTESALSFLLENHSIFIQGSNNLAFPRIPDSALESLLAKLNVPQEKQKNIVDQFHTITDKMQRALSKEEPRINRWLGDFYLIGLPKDHVDDPNQSIVYPCHGYGRPLKGYLDNPIQKDLSELQNKGPIRSRIVSHVQYRILAHQMSREKGMRVFRFSFIPKNIFQEAKKAIHTLVEKEILSC